MLVDDPGALVTRLLDVIERDIAPLTRTGVGRGDKVFGGAILTKSDGALVVAGTNRETESPIWHGEMATIERFSRLPAANRPRASDCLFLSTHEPCSMCLSAITWAGFDNFYYLFSYEDSRDDFRIPHDLEILEEVFGCPQGAYAPANAYWTSHSIAEVATRLDADGRERFARRRRDLGALYAELSSLYQASRGGGAIPLA